MPIADFNGHRIGWILRKVRDYIDRRHSLCSIQSELLKNKFNLAVWCYHFGQNHSKDTIKV